MSTDSSRFGYEPEQWQAAVDSGVKLLQGVAGSSKPQINYSDLCDRIMDDCGVEVIPGEYALPHLLGDICRVTLESDNIAITALVVYKGGNDAGPGLFDLAVAEKLLPASPSEDKKLEFQVEQTRLAVERWKRPRREPGARYSK